MFKKIKFTKINKTICLKSIFPNKKSWRRTFRLTKNIYKRRRNEKKVLKFMIIHLWSHKKGALFTRFRTNSKSWLFYCFNFYFIIDDPILTTTTIVQRKVKHQSIVIGFVFMQMVPYKMCTCRMSLCMHWPLNFNVENENENTKKRPPESSKNRSSL